MWGKLLSDTYQKVRTKADEVREQVSSAVQAQQATISKAREVLLSLGGGGGSSTAAGSLSRGGADAFAAAAAAAHLSAEDVQRLLQREAGEICTLDEARDIFTTWRQLILQSGLHGSPRFTSSGEQQTDEEQHQQRRWGAGSSKSRKDGAQRIATASAAEHEEEAGGSRRVHDAAVAGKERKPQQVQPYRAEGAFSSGAGAAGASPAAEQHWHMEHVAEAEGRKGLEDGGEAATASSARPHDHPQQHPITRAPSSGSSAAAIAKTYPQIATAGARPVDGGARHASVTVHHPTGVGGVVPAAAAAAINYAVAIPRPTPPTFATALEEEAARGERSCFLDGFSFKEIFLRSTALERALLSLAKKETLRVFFAAHVLELLLAVKKQHKEQQQQQRLAEGGEAKKEVTTAGGTGGDGRSGGGRGAAGARAEGDAGTTLETVREDGVKGKEAAKETEMPRVIGSELGAPATAAGGAAATAAEAADATTTASPSSQTSQVSSSSSTTTTEDSSSSVDEGSNGSIKTADKQSAEEQQHQLPPQQGHDQHRGGTAAGGEVKPAGGGMALHHRDVATTGAAAPPAPPVVSTLLALLSLCSPGTQEQHLMLLHALFTVATAAAPPAASLESTLQQQQKQQRQLLREFYASGGQRSKGVLLASASRHSSRSRTLEQQKQQDNGGGAQQQQPHNGALLAGRVTTEATSGSVTQRAADGSTLSASGFSSAASSEATGAAGTHGREDSSQGGAALDSHVAAATEEQQHREGSNTCFGSAGSAAAPFSSGAASEECTATQQEALAALERVLLLFSLWKRPWLLERREDARRRLEEEGRHLAAKIESCDLPVDGADAVPTDASDSAPADPLVSHNIRLLANAQLLRLQQQVLLLKEELLQEQRAAAAEKVRRLRELQGVWEKQDAAAAAARQVTGGEQEIQNQMAKASEVLIQEAGLVEERRVALHQKLKSLQEKKLLLEQELADCLQMIAAAEREQEKLFHEEEDVRVELLHVQMQYKQQVQQHQQQQQQQARLEQALQDLDSTAADLADYAVLDAQRREAAATADIQRVQGALQTQVCRHFAFEKTRLQQQVHLLQHHVQLLEQLLKEQQQHPEERMEDEQRRQLLHARRRFIRAAHQLDVMYGETLSFAEQHRRILALAIRQQWQTLRGKAQEQQQQNEGEEAATVAGNNSVLQEEQLARKKGEQEEQIDPMKDIKAIYTTTKKQLAPYIAQLASSTAATAEGHGAQEVRRASAVHAAVPAASAGEVIPAGGGKAAADAWVSEENVAGSPAHAVRPRRLSQGQQQQQLQHQELRKLDPQGQQGTPAEKTKECAAGATAVGPVRQKEEEQPGRSVREARRLSEAGGGVPLLVEGRSDPVAFLQQVQWQQQAEERLSPSQRHVVQQYQHTRGHHGQLIPPQHRFEQQEQSQQPALQQEPHEGARFQFPVETGRKQEATQLFQLTTPPSSPTVSPRFNRYTQLPAAAEQHGSMPQQQSNTLERPGFSGSLQLFGNEPGPLQQQQQHISSTPMQQSSQEQQRQHFVGSEEPEQLCSGKQQPHHFSIEQQQSNFPQPPPPVQAEKKEQMEEDGDNSWLL